MTQFLELINTIGIEKPKDLEESEVLSEFPYELQITSNILEIETLLSPDSIYFQRKGNFKKNNPKGKATQNSGYYDDSSNSSQFKKEKKSYNWFVKKGQNHSDGPFTDSEMKRLSDDGSLVDTLIRRDFDKGFVEYNKMIKEYPNFFLLKNLNKYFKENQILIENEEESVKDNCFDIKETDYSPNPKLKNFLENCNVHIDPLVMIQNIKNMRKNNAIRKLKEITDLEINECTILVELLIESSKTQILSDVDKNGFIINNRTTKNYQKNRKFKIN